MQELTFTIIDNGRPVDVSAIIAGGTVGLPSGGLKAALGWELKPEGLCRGAICVPLPAGSLPVTDAGIDLAALAAVLGRPLALDPDERAAFLGVPARERSRALASLDAPDFTLPDLAGRPHSLTDALGNKILLIAYASW